jgi:LysR family transcriptional regulator for bpeEF and oprC
METIQIELSRLFVKVVQHGGYSKAANALRLPKSTISKAIKRLEDETGTKLLIRTTRSQTLTAAGRLFYETCLEPIQILENAQKSLYGQDNIISGRIKLTAPEDLGNFVITKVISRFSKKYEKLDFETHYSNEVMDLVKDGFDFAIRIGTLKESSLKQKKIGEFELIPVASPNFLGTVRSIREPRDLDGLNGVVLLNVGQDKITLRNERKAVSIKIKPRISCNHMSSVITAAALGAGVAVVPSYLVKEHLKSGSLIRILPKWNGPKFPVSVVSPTSMSSSSRISILINEIIAECRQTFES